MSFVPAVFVGLVIFALNLAKSVISPSKSTVLLALFKVASSL